MKKHLLFFLVLFALGSCTLFTQDPPKDDTKKELILSDNALPTTFNSSGGTFVVRFTAHTAWDAVISTSRAIDWCQLSPSSGDAGKAELAVKVTSNTTDYERHATIRIKAGETTKTFVVTQKQNNALTRTPSKIEIEPAGGIAVVEVKENINFSYEIDPSHTDWITMPEQGTQPSARLQFRIDTHNNIMPREGIITIRSGEDSEKIRIYQAVNRSQLVLTPTKHIVRPDGQIICIELKSDVEYTVTTPENTWVEEMSSSHLSTHTRYYLVRPNETEAPRTMQIVFNGTHVDRSETVTITQAEPGAIILTQNEYDFGPSGGALDFEVISNIDFTVAVSPNAREWISQVASRGMEQTNLHFDIAENKQLDERTGTITLSDGFTTQVVTLRQRGTRELYEADRQALIALYNATGGDRWTNKDNWCSDKPLDTWHGVFLADGRVNEISLAYNNLLGVIPAEIGNFTQLTSLDLWGNKLAGSIPAEIGNLAQLTVLNLASNQFSGSIPPEIGNLTQLTHLDLSSNPLSGSIPAEIGNLTQLIHLDLWGNLLSGLIPEQVTRLAVWQTQGWHILLSNELLDTESAQLCVPDITEVDMDGNTIHLRTKVGYKQYTALFFWANWCPYSHSLIPTMASIYHQYKNKGFGVVSFIDASPSEREAVEQTIREHNMTWSNIFSPQNQLSYAFPTVVIVDDKGMLKWRGAGFNIGLDIEEFLFNKLGEPEPPETPYESTDYTLDGSASLLQRAGTGQGINLVLMGDAFSDRQVATGKYEATMRKAMEHFFEEEPYRSFRDYFNVYAVTAISKNEGYIPNGETALQGYFGEGTHVGGNDNQCFDYALKTGEITNSKLDNTLIMVVMNSHNYAGTCYMYYSNYGDYGNGTAVAYLPMGGDDLTFAQVIHHEAGGHGFTKLSDEYSNSGTIPATEINELQYRKQYGWWKNVDVTSDLKQIKWAHFISDPRYAAEELGAYEGAYTYTSGVWRPTENSIMRYNTGGFNAPSREAIYYRIHKLALGESWQYDYETFVAWDAVNRTAEASSRLRTAHTTPRNFRPLHPPVVVGKIGDYSR